MLTTTLALLLAAAPGEAPAPVAQEVEVAAEPAARPSRGSLRMVMGAGVLQDANGVSPLLDAGYAFDPWPRMGFRLDLGLAVGVGWSAVQAGPSFVIRGAGPGARLTPYCSVGLEAAAVGVNPNLVGSGSRVAQPARTLSPAVHTATPSGNGSDSAASSLESVNNGGIPFRFSFGPQAGAGLLWSLGRDFALDLSARYDLRIHGGKAHSGGGLGLGFVSTF